MRALFREIGRFRRDKSGNIAVIFAIALLPVLTAVGSAIDYSMATKMRAKLQSAADAASVASISQKSPGYTAAAAMTGNGSVASRRHRCQQRLRRQHERGSPVTPIWLVPAPSPKPGIRLTSSVTFSADVPTTFMQVGWLSQNEGDRNIRSGRLAAAVSRFLPDAGRFGIDGAGVNPRRTDAPRRRQPG